ncbi:hypothetical protein [Lacihabitans lacunae]|uniref:Uncharacterized protein n=1 Tax=Lacihabitans lacunae TaxID=1028214 RepID=A0ABV7YNV4_9BACT
MKVGDQAKKLGGKEFDIYFGDQAKKLGERNLIFTLGKKNSFMTQDFIQLLLPEGLFEYFDLVRYKPAISSKRFIQGSLLVKII